MDIQLKVDFDRLTLDDLVAVEEGDQSARFVRSILARFLVDPDTGDFYPEDQAIIKAGKLSVPKAEEAVLAFADQIKELKAAKIPPIKSGN